MDAWSLRAPEALCDGISCIERRTTQLTIAGKLPLHHNAELSAGAATAMIAGASPVIPVCSSGGHSVAQDLIPRLDDIDAAGVGETAEAPAMTPPHHFSSRGIAGSYFAQPV